MMGDRYKPEAGVSWHQEKLKLANTFRLWGVTEWSAEPNVIEARANLRYMSGPDSDVTVRFVKDGREVTLVMRQWDHPPTNLKVLRLCIDDMRMIERRGLDQTMASAYLQLAGPQGPVERDPWEVLGLRPGAAPELVEAVYKTLARSAHPDTGGSDEAMKELNRARAKVLGEAVPA